MTSDKEPRHVAGLVDRFTCTWLAACGDADKSYPPSLFSFSPAYTLPLFLLSPITNTHTHTFREGGTSSVCSASGSEDSEWSSSSDDESEALYHRRYVSAKKMAKGIIYVCPM